MAWGEHPHAFRYITYIYTYICMYPVPALFHAAIFRNKCDLSKLPGHLGPSLLLNISGFREPSGMPEYRKGPRGSCGLVFVG